MIFPTNINGASYSYYFGAIVCWDYLRAERRFHTL